MSDYLFNKLGLEYRKIDFNLKGLDNSDISNAVCCVTDIYYDNNKSLADINYEIASGLLKCVSLYEFIDNNKDGCYILLINDCKTAISYIDGILYLTDNIINTIGLDSLLTTTLNFAFKYNDYYYKEEVFIKAGEQYISMWFSMNPAASEFCDAAIQYEVYSVENKTHIYGGEMDYSMDIEKYNSILDAIDSLLDFLNIKEDAIIMSYSTHHAINVLGLK